MSNFGSNFTDYPVGQYVLVASGNQAMPATGAISNAASTAANIADGQIGAICSDHYSAVRSFGDFLQAGDDVSDVQLIRLVQGTPNSADITQTYPNQAVSHQNWVETPDIDGRGSITFTAKACDVGTLDSWIVGEATGGAQEIVAADNSTYSVNIGWSGVRQDRRYSLTQIENIPISVTTPDFTLLGTVDPKDWLVQNIVAEANLHSNVLGFNSPSTARGNRNMIAFAIDNSGLSGGVTLSSIVTGSVIPVVTYNGTVHNYTATAEMAASVLEWIATGNVAGTSTIINVDATTSGASADADQIIIMATPHYPSLVQDTIPEIRPRLYVGIEYGFSAPEVLLVHASRNNEGHGQGRKWKLIYDSRHRLSVYTAQNRPMHNYFVETPNYVDESIYYTAYIIKCATNGSVEYSHTYQKLIEVVILVPCDPSTGATDATTLASLNAILGPWLASANLERVISTSAMPSPFI